MRETDAKQSRSTRKAAPASKGSVASRPVVIDADTPRFRSGAVARMLRMPVATLRIWERRYRVSAAALTGAGHRLYSALDVQRLALMRQLTELGHSIGAIASLDMTGLRDVAGTHAGMVARARQAAPRPAGTCRVAVVGRALVRRLQQPRLRQRLGRPLEVVAAFASLAEVASQAEVAGLAEAAAPPTGPQVDVLLAELPGVHDDLLGELQAASRACGARGVAVLYGFGAQAAIDALAAGGVALWRQPLEDRALAASLEALFAATRGPAPGAVDPASPADPLWLSVDDVAPRRYDDATLADFAGLSSTIACECPRHVAELLVQLSRFEAYSAQCESRGPKDAALHAYLARVAGASRALFETALERIANQEGLVLPG